MEEGMSSASRNLIGSLWLSALLLAGCPGDEAGAPASHGGGVIGPEGGSVSSQDQRLTLTIPKGALRTPTAISVQAVSEQAPAQVGEAFQIAPANVHFDKPALLKLTLDDRLAASTSSAQLHVAGKRGQEWIWYPTRPLEQEAEAEVSETGIFSLVPGAQLLPGEAKVKLASALGLEIVRCTAETPEDPAADPVVLGYTCEKGGLSAISAKDWSVNAVKGGTVAIGTIAASGSETSANATAQFLAPFAKPAQNPVAVSVVVEFGDEDEPTLTSTLVSNIEIVDEDPPAPEQDLASVELWDMHYEVDSNCDHAWQEFAVSYDRKERHHESGDLKLRRSSFNRDVVQLEGTGTVSSSFDKSTVQASQYFSKTRYDRGAGPSQARVRVTIDIKRGAYDVYFQHGDFSVEYGGVDSYASGSKNEYGPSHEELSVISAPILATGELTRTLPRQSLTIEDNYDFASYWSARQSMDADFDLEAALREVGGCPSGKTSWVLKPAR
jgi:hypothetical protein